MANNPNQNQGNQNQGKQDQAKQGNQSSQQQVQRDATREMNPNRPAGEPGKLPQNAGSALDSGKGGTATQQQQQSKSQSTHGDQSKSMRDDSSQKHGTPTKGNDSRGGRADETDQDGDSPSGIGQAVRKGDSESAKHGEDDLGQRSDKGKSGGNNKPM